MTCLAAVGQLVLASPPASATHTLTVQQLIGRSNMLDCNATFMERLCTDPHGPMYHGHWGRFTDPITHQYVGHDEPSVKFESTRPGSGNTMNYTLQLPTDPKMAPTPSGSVTDYAELSAAPWFGLGICDPRSYPQNPCKPLSDSNSGLISNPNDAGSAFMELQWYPPGLAPGDGFVDSTSCSAKQWCAALTIDSLECTFNFATCNNNCIEPVNFAFMQTNGTPAGPPGPSDPNVKTYLGDSHTLKMNSGDMLTASISNTPAGLKASVTDLTTHQTGFMVASAKNGFQNTSMSNCAGHPFSFHAEYSSAKPQNQTPWAALEGGVLMQQEIGHGESCASVTNKLPFTMTFKDGSSFKDPQVFQTCVGGTEGKGKTGEGPCNPSTGVCQHSTTQGMHGPVACPVNKVNTALCEFSDGRCFAKGSRPFFVDGHKTMETAPVADCNQEGFENGDLDYDGNSYIPDWPNGSPSHPTSFRYTGPLTNGHRYPNIQFETDAAASESLCVTATGVNCTAPPISAKFYPYWTLTDKNAKAGVCVWNFGADIANVTTNDFGKAAEYGKPDIARFGGTLTSKVMPNPEFLKNCGA